LISWLAFLNAGENEELDLPRGVVTPHAAGDQSEVTVQVELRVVRYPEIDGAKAVGRWLLPTDVLTVR
jgi:hypothetical protein